LTDWLLAILRFNVNRLEQTAGIVGEAIDSIIEAIPIYGPPISTLVDALQFIVDVGISVVKNSINDPSYREEVACVLYCILKRQPAGGNKFTTVVFDQWLSNLPGAGAVHFANLAGSVIGWAECSRRFFLYAYAQSSTLCEGLCECPDDPDPCEVLLDFDQNMVSYNDTGNNTTRQVVSGLSGFTGNAFRIAKAGSSSNGYIHVPLPTGAQRVNIYFRHARSGTGYVHIGFVVAFSDGTTQVGNAVVLNGSASSNAAATDFQYPNRTVPAGATHLMLGVFFNNAMANGGFGAYDDIRIVDADC
jgi:hypothetical protein